MNDGTAMVSAPENILQTVLSSLKFNLKPFQQIEIYFTADFIAIERTEREMEKKTLFRFVSYTLARCQ